MEQFDKIDQILLNLAQIWIKYDSWLYKQNCSVTYVF